MDSLFSQLVKYGESDRYPCHMPGHKRNGMGELPRELAGIDITEIDGFDNLHQPEDLFRRLQEKAAALYGAEESFYLVNGSTCGILSAISATVGSGETLLMDRGCHKAVYHSVYLRGLQAAYIPSGIVAGYGIREAATPEAVESALRKNPQARAVLIVSPTYEGRIADVGAIADIVHKRGIPLIVDEAHGAHLGFEEHFAPNSCRLGADLVIHSTHKTLPALTQTALLHVNGALVDRDLLRRFLRIYQTSSPSYVLMASIDNALSLCEREGKQLFGEFYSRYAQMTQQLRQCKRLRFLPQDGKRQDIGKLVIFAGDSGLSGREIYDILREKYNLQLEMAAGDYCLAMFTMGDTREGYERMTRALLELDAEMVREDHKATGEIGRAADADRGTISPPDPEVVIPLAKAWDCKAELVSLDTARDRICAEFVNLYPPGVPLLVPGERISAQMPEYLESLRQAGLDVQGITEGETAQIRVLC